MPSLSTQATITFLYYDDLPRACQFYESALGLDLVIDQGWCKIYAITPQSWVGLVDAEHGTHKPAADKPVILSFVTDDVDAWHAHLTKLGAPMFRPLGTSQAIGVRGFMALDPGGYTLEFETFLDAPRNAKALTLIGDLRKR